MDEVISVSDSDSDMDMDIDAIADAEMEDSDLISIKCKVCEFEDDVLDMVREHVRNHTKEEKETALLAKNKEVVERPSPIQSTSRPAKLTTRLTPEEEKKCGMTWMPGYGYKEETAAAKEKPTPILKPTRSKLKVAKEETRKKWLQEFNIRENFPLKFESDTQIRCVTCEFSFIAMDKGRVRRHCESNTHTTVQTAKVERQ